MEMDPKRIGMIVAVLVAVGFAVYYFMNMNTEPVCTEIAEKDACVLPCKWDEYFGGGVGRCVDKETDLTRLEGVVEKTDDASSNLPPPAPAQPAQVDISGVSGLTGRYTAESYSASQKLWKDESGKTNDFRVAGDLKISDDKLYVFGGAAEKFTLPSVLFDRQYTIFIVSKYNGDAKRRILTSAEGWFSGHNDGKSGVAYHNNWVTEDVDHFGDAWVLSTDQRNLYRANGNRYSGYGLDESFPRSIGVNIAQGQESDYAIAEILVYDRELSESEYLKIEKMLMDKYSISPSRFARAGLFTSYDNNLYGKQLDCGPTSGIAGFKLAANNDKFRYEYNCMLNLDKSGDALDLTTEYKAKTDKFYDTMLDETLDCGARPIESYKFDVKNSNQTQVRYRCTDAEVDSPSCREVTSSDQDINVLTAHDIQCENNEVMTYLKFEKTANDPNKTRYVYKCCKPKGY